MPHCNCPLKEAARATPHQLACQPLTFSELDEEAERLSGELQKLGVQPGDRIAIRRPPCPTLIALLFAAWRLGASPCPLNLRLPPAQIESCLARLAPKLLVDSFPLRHAPMPSFKSAPQSLFLFTSGSTGTPKIAVLSLESLIANAAANIPLARGDRWLLSLPLFHVGGIGIVLRCILKQAAIALDEKDPAITHLSYVPTQLYRSTPIYKNLKCLLLGGAPPTSYPEHLPVAVAYGLTEMGSTICARLRPPRPGGLYHLGFPLPGREVRLNPDGEILVRGQTLFQGYWEKGRIEPPPDWFPTGDLGRIDKEEGLAILGRKDWQFISGGENIQPEEIERHLLQIPAVIDAAVVPRSDPEFGQRPVAFVKSADPSFDLNKMQESLRERLPKYKIPVALFLLDELPKNSLKIARKELFEIANQKSHTTDLFRPQNS